ncbi:MAG TPA: NlpC/P60 family protein, partial [Candidatus Eisenbacteria bacterium]|nr:NlpC/P60 family protein [Candidatus Eisenbacteria bacterium]
MASTRRTSRHALTALAVCTAATTALALVPGSAAATPRPTIQQVQAQVDALDQQAEQATERYNEARVQLAAVQLRLTTVRHRLARQQAKVGQLQDVMGRLAAASYKSGGLDSTMQLLLSDHPDTFLQQASALNQLGRRQDEALRRMTAARQQLRQDQDAVDQQHANAMALQRQLEAEKSAVEAKLAQAQALLDSLKAEERARLEAARQSAIAQARAQAAAAARASRSASRTPARSGGGGGSTATYNGPASGRASVAVRTAYAQLGDPYVWGASGPNAFDCSGLTMYAWRAAGVSLPHSAAMQYNSGRHVSRSNLQPGDLVFFYSPISHVGIYIGGGKMIDAPHTG